mmetsp:Transcript_70252/g.86194  ORF Transcript_70252/g.86194 Transcript_70252/m.86194 type:complete len:416 (+) Transcript_70252:181-1428(+)
MVAVGLLHCLGKLGPNKAVLLSNRTKALSHAALHALQATHVDMCLLILHQFPKLLGILGHLGLDVHLLSCRILVLTAHGIVVFELTREFLLVGLVLVIIQQRLGVWHAHEEPSQALELAATICTSSSLVMEEQPQVGTHGCNASAGGQHDDVGFWVFRQQHLSSRGTCDQHIISNTHIANVVRANTTVDLVLWESSSSLVGFVFTLGSVAELAIQLHHALHAQGHRLGALIITHSRRGNGVQADLGWLLTLLVWARRNDSNGLPLDVRNLASMVKGDMSGLPVRITSGLSQSLGVKVIRDHLALVRSFGGKEVPRNFLAMHNLHTLLLHCSCIAAGRCLSSSCHQSNTCQASKGCSASHASHPSHATAVGLRDSGATESAKRMARRRRRHKSSGTAVCEGHHSDCEGTSKCKTSK